MREQKEVDISLLVADAIANNKNLHKVIDDIYLKNEVVLSEINVLDKARSFDFGSIEFQKYFIRTLQILEASLEDFKDINVLDKALKKEYNYEYNYIKRLNRDELDLEVYFNYLGKKVRNKNLTNDEFNWRMYILLYFAINNGIQVVDSEVLQLVFENINLYHRDSNNNIFAYKNIDKDNLKLINDKIKMLKEEYPQINSNTVIFNKPIEEIKKNKLTRKEMNYVALEYLYDKYRIDLNAVCKYKAITNKELAELLNIYLMAHFGEFGTDSSLKDWIVYAVQINYLIKAYREAKDLSYENSSSALIDKIKVQNNKIEELSGIINKVRNDNKELNEENEKLKREVKRLRNENRELRNGKLEIDSLREFMFNQENEVVIDDEVDLNSMANVVNNKRLLIIGGNDIWKRKMKETLNQCTFISPNVSFDNRILEDRDVVINTDYIGHSMYYKVISNINKINSFRFFSGSGNVELSIRKLYKLVRE